MFWKSYVGFKNPHDKLSPSITAETEVIDQWLDSYIIAIQIQEAPHDFDRKRATRDDE